MATKNVNSFLTVNSLNLSTASILTIVGGELKRFTGQTIVIDSSGNVGIGNTNPGAKLDVTGNIRLSAVNPNIEFNNGGAMIYSPAANTLAIATGGGLATPTERLRIDSSGNVGIGITPTAKLNVYDAIAATVLVQGDTGAQIILNRASADATAPVLALRKSRGSVASPAAVASADALGVLNFQGFGGTNVRNLARISGNVEAYVSDTDISSNLIFFTTPPASGVTITERMRIDSSGNVGIGITTPLVKTHIRYARSGGAASDTIAGLFLDAYHGEVTFPTVGSSIYLRSSRSATLGTQAASINGDDSRIRFYFSDGTNFVPAAAVNGSVDGAPAAGSVAGKLLFLTTSAAATVPSTKMTIDKAGIVTITNLGTGTVSSTAGVLSAASDARMKISDGEIENAINKIQNLKPKYFYWKDENNNKDESKGRQLGFFAQEVNEQVPEAAPGLNDQWGIYDRSLIAVLVKAVQELKVEIDILKNK